MAMASPSAPTARLEAQRFSSTSRRPNRLRDWKTHPLKNGDLPMKNGDLPIEKWWFTHKNSDLPMKNRDLPIKNGDWPMKIGIFL